MMKNILVRALLMALPLFVAACNATTTADVSSAGSSAEKAPLIQRGTASWYGPGFAGRRTASGETFNPGAMTAAHRHLPFGARVKVVNNATGQSVVVRINDRGPFIRGRIIDLARAPAGLIGLTGAGVGYVSLHQLN